MKKSVFRILLLFLIILSLGCTKRAADDTAQVYWVDENVLKIHMDEEPFSLDPAKAVTLGDFLLLPAIYRTLFTYEEELVPSENLLSSWDVSPDGLTYSYYLDEDAKFSNGKSITAEDVKFSWERVLNPATSSPWSHLLLEVQGAESYRKGRKEEVEGIKVVSPFSFTVSLTESVPDFNLRLTHPAAAVLSRENVEANGVEFGMPGDYLASAPQIVASGALVPMEWVDDFLMRLNKNKYYPKAGGERFEIDFFGDYDTVSVEWEQGKWDIIQGRKKDYLQIEAEIVEKRDLWQLTYLQFQNKSEAWSDFRLRLALGAAVDRNVLASTTEELSRPSKNLLPGKNEVNLKRDWNTALELVRDAGFETIDSLPPLSLAYFQNINPQITEQLAAQLKEFGLNVQVLPPERLNQADIVLRKRTLSYLDIKAWLLSFYSTYPEEELNSDELETNLLSGGEVLPLYFASQIWLVSEEVDNFNINALGMPSWTAMKK